MSVLLLTQVLPRLSSGSDRYPQPQVCPIM